MADKIDTFIEGVVKLARVCDLSQIEFIETLAQMHASSVTTFIDINKIDKPRKFICDYIDNFANNMQNIYTKGKIDAEHGDDWQTQNVHGDWQKSWTPDIYATGKVDAEHGDETSEGKEK